MAQGFNPDEYSSVADRISAFHVEYPQSRIITEYVIQPLGDLMVVVFSASIFKNPDELCWTTGHSLERLSQAFALEKAETSAIGRALANANYAAKLDTPRPSREEMSNVSNLHAVPNDDPWTVTPEADTNAPMCNHGLMEYKEGKNKVGKAYKGHFCTEPDTHAKCAPVWVN
jgi:hypothetical protein